MRRSTLVMYALLAVAISGCERVKDVVARFRGQEELAEPAPAGPASRPTRPVVEPAVPAPAPELTARPVAAPARPLEDTPFSSPDTGTVVPGVGEREVYALWGPPVSVRRAGEWTYLFFRNGCEYSCGTYDVVFLQNGVVVDAIVRWWGHIYGGESSSPADVVPLPTQGGDVLRVTPSPADTAWTDPGADTGSSDAAAADTIDPDTAPAAPADTTFPNE